MPSPLILPLGDGALLVRFADTLGDEANRAAIAFAASVERRRPEGVLEIVPNLVSVLMRYDPAAIGFALLAGEIRLLTGLEAAAPILAKEHLVAVRFDGQDLAEVAETLGMDRDAFITAHNTAPLRVLTTGFAPGFVYLGFHPDSLILPRRPSVRPSVPAGSVLFAAGQTAIAATSIPTGWHVIGSTDFRNFDPASDPPTTLMAGDVVRFEDATP